MSSEITTISSQEIQQHAPSFFQMEPEKQVIYASRIATVLRDVVEKQKLYSNIGGKNYIRVEGWQTLGTFLGVLAKERGVSRLADGSYEAIVDLVKFGDGTVVGGASALCSIGEKRWGNTDEYARRSMAITRATGKAYRCAFSWIVSLAGYEVTPEEEIPREEKRVESRPEIYTGETAQQEKIAIVLRKQNIPEENWDEVNTKMMGRPGKDLPRVLREMGFGGTTNG